MNTKIFSSKISVILLLTASVANAEGDCAKVYSNAVANVSIETKERSVRSFYFNLYCEQTGSTKAFATSGAVSFPIKGIPLEANGDASWDQAELKNFCKIGSEKNYFHGSDFAYGRYVVTDALKSFNECRALEAEGLIVTHQVAPPTSFTVYGAFTGVVIDASLDTITYDKALMECSSTNFNEDKKSEVIDGRIGYKLKKSNFNIACARKPVVSGDKKYYPRATFQMSTSLGPYTVTLPGDHHFGFELASQAQASHAEAVSELNSFREKYKSELSSHQRYKSLYEGMRLFNIYQGSTGALAGAESVGCIRLSSKQNDPHTLNHMKGVCSAKNMEFYSYRFIHCQPGGGCGGCNWALICRPK